MSEYQYYEFVAIDRPLTRTEMDELRRLSTRAQITPTRFTNEYHFGDFRGDPSAMMARYFDAFVYLSNFGSREFMVRLPASAVDAQALRQTEVPFGVFNGQSAGDQVVLCFHGSDDDGEFASEDDDGASWMVRLLRVREALMRGDPRPLYLGWLLGIRAGAWSDEDLEPPVPPGLSELPQSLSDLAAFLWLDEDLVAAAAEASAPLAPAVGLRDWIAALPVEEKDRLLAQVADDKGPAVAAEIHRRFRSDSAVHPDKAPPRRSVADLLAAADAQGILRRERERLEAEKERAQQAAAAAAAQERRLVTLTRRGAAAWQDLERQIARKQAPAYAEAVDLLADLRLLAERERQQDAFRTRLSALRETHASKRTFIARLDAAGLR